MVGERMEEEDAKCNRVRKKWENIYNLLYLLLLSITSACLTTPRTTFGQFHINTLFFKDPDFNFTDPNWFDYLMEIFLHETIHILGFSKELYPYFQKPDGTFYAATEMFKLVDQNVFLALPTVRDISRNYFDCQSLEGMLLENDEFYLSVKDLSNNDNNLKSVV